MTDLSAVTRTVRTKIVVCDCGCWVWTGSLDRHGYANVKMHGKRVLVHRYIFDRVVGPLGADDTIDHLCDRHRSCVNPDHFEAVPRSENSRRANVRRWHGGDRDRSACSVTSD